MKNLPDAGLYIHIPFCICKCPYCDFYSVAGSAEHRQAYARRVLRSLEHYAARYPGGADTLYFGGGTPLLMGAELLGELTRQARRLFRMEGDSEITAEGNPGTALEADLAGLRAAGVNRLSFGLQSAHAGELAALGRRHSAADAAETVAAAQKAGFKNISLDLMLGVPRQTEGSLRESVRFAAGLGVTHISAYMLKIEEGTPLASSPLRAECADDDGMAGLYEAACDELERAGFRQYEISNFALPGFECRHNLKYWRDQEYIGIGPAAHGYMEGRRWFIRRDIAAYMEGEDAELERFEGPGGGWEEEAMLRLRLREGLDAAALAAKYPDAPAEAMLERAEVLMRAGLARVSGSVISLTPRGFLVSNSATGEILYN